MDITINASFLPHTDPEASLAFYRDNPRLRGPRRRRIRPDAVDHRGLRASPAPPSCSRRRPPIPVPPARSAGSSPR